MSGFRRRLNVFGGSNDDLEPIATLLDSDSSASAVESEVEAIADVIDDSYSQVEDQLSPHRHIPADAKPLRKAEAVKRAINADHGGSGRRSTDDEVGETAVRAAANTRDEIRPSSPLGQRLLDHLSGTRPASTQQLEQTLQSTTEQLDAREQNRSALNRLDPSADVHSIPDLVEAYQNLDRQHRSGETTYKRLADEVEALLDELDVDAEGSLEQQVRTATRTARESSQKPESDAGAVEDAVAGVRTSSSPRSRRARELLDALEAGDADETAETLEMVTAELDRAATADALLQDVDTDHVLSLAKKIQSKLNTVDGPLATVVRNRADELAERVSRVDETNRVVPFAAREELKFYRRELVTRVSGDSADTGDVGLTDDLERLRQRRDAIEHDYIDQRSDHNHSIPLYFLSLVDAGLEDVANDINAGHTNRAAGTIDQLEAVLEHVEGLYEQNQYSVMLRSLRG